MKYHVTVNAKVKKNLLKIEKPIACKIVDKINSLSLDPRPMGVTKLSGEENVYRIRVGDYRIIYEIHDSQILILVINVGHRREVYKKS